MTDYFVPVKNMLLKRRKLQIGDVEFVNYNSFLSFLSQLIIAKSPVAPAARLTYTIESQGIVMNGILSFSQFDIQYGYNFKRFCETGKAQLSSLALYDRDLCDKQLSNRAENYLILPGRYPILKSCVCRPPFCNLCCHSDTQIWNLSLSPCFCLCFVFHILNSTMSTALTLKPKAVIRSC